MMISTNARAELLEVFTTQAYPVALNGLPAVVCFLDELSTIRMEINRRPQEAIAHNAQLTHFYHCQNQAIFYELTSLPAIVIDKTYVAYGFRAIDKARIACRYFKAKEVTHD